MRDIQMDVKKREGSPSTGVSGTSPKRRKIDDPVDPSFPISPANNIQALNDTIPHQSCRIAVSKPHLDQISSEINNLFDEERQILEDEIKFYKLANENLESRLAESEKRCQEAKVSAAARIADLLQKNSELEHQAAENTEKLNAALDRIIELQQEVKSAGKSHETINVKALQLQELNLRICKLETEKQSLCEEIQNLLPSVEWIKQFGRGLQSARATPQEASEEIFCDEMIFNDHKISNEAGSFEEAVPGNYELPPVLVKEPASNELEVPGHGVPPVLVKQEMEDICHQPQQKAQKSPEEREDLRVKREEIERGEAEADSKSSRKDFAAPISKNLPKKIARVNGSSSLIKRSDDKGAGSDKNQRIYVDEFYVLPSHPTFFEIEWETLYQQKGRTCFECTDCGEVRRTRSDVQDHIWIKHYGGKLRCPLCPERSVTFSRRFRIKRHMATVHAA